jgi:hypothetical protein
MRVQWFATVIPVARQPGDFQVASKGTGYGKKAFAARAE